MKHYRIIGADNLPYFCSRAEPPPGHPGKPAPVEVPRMPEDFEDWINGKWVKNFAGAADHKAGPEGIAAAHAQKVIEARLFKAGVALDGLLAAEAAALGISQADLATQIVNNSKAALDNEVRRRTEKSKGTK